MRGSFFVGFNSIWSDMTIEQTLMRSMKTDGGLSRGRGLSDGTLLKWILCAPACSKVIEAVQHFTGTLSATSEQHVELRDSRIKRDTKDYNIFYSWLKKHNPFMDRGDALVSVSNGLIANEKINCDSALERGEDAINSLVGKDFISVVFGRKNKVIPLAAQSCGIKVHNNNVPINPQQLFNRIICVINNQNDLKTCFTYELASKPASLFDEVSMRKGVKSSLMTMFETVKRTEIPKNFKYVIDGGHLLYSAAWPNPSTYGGVIEMYVSQILRNYGSNSIIVFDGYPDTPTTKGEEQRRRNFNKACSDIEISEDNVVNISQSTFLSNRRNKKRLIELIMTRLRTMNIQTHQAEADADISIADFAIQQSKAGESVVVVGQDIDVLVLLLSLASPGCKLWYLRPASGKKAKENVYDICKERKRLGRQVDFLLFIHAMTGCGTSSAFFRKGKVKGYKILEKLPLLQREIRIFYEKNASKVEIATAGEKFILQLYSAPPNIHSLDDLRFYVYNRTIAKLQLHSKFDLAILPPTCAAAAEHSYRVYGKYRHGWEMMLLQMTLAGIFIKTHYFQGLRARNLHLNTF